MKLTRILFVDDSPLMHDILRLYTRRILGSDIEMDSAFSGEQGLAKSSMFEYSLIVTDQNMPKMKGLDMILKIIELETDRSTKTPFIHISSDVLAIRETEKMLKNSEFHTHTILTLLKPISPDEWLTTMKQIL